MTANPDLMTLVQVERLGAAAERLARAARLAALARRCCALSTHPLDQLVRALRPTPACC